MCRGESGSWAVQQSVQGWKTACQTSCRLSIDSTQYRLIAERWFLAHVHKQRWRESLSLSHTHTQAIQHRWRGVVLHGTHRTPRSFQKYQCCASELEGVSSLEERKTLRLGIRIYHTIWHDNLQINFSWLLTVYNNVRVTEETFIQFSSSKVTSVIFMSYFHKVRVHDACRYLNNMDKPNYEIKTGGPCWANPRWWLLPVHL